MENFAQTCVEASQHILVMAQTVLDDKYLPQCNPFVMGLDVMSHFFRSERREAVPTTTTSTFKEESLVVPAAPPPISSIPMMPSTIMQQPSPDENLSLSSGMTTNTGMAQGVDPSSGGDSGI
ncbi:hypothetical protein E0Z10_g8442 [Xylaria hypoxylon]|uniref:Uncharacterized protein n=1 Tax=Xylaria hypoxylon TaxID=37992 RepID=A0A4Z0YMA9_9PEZI|nr:hypothetical protein E0Z10_g8442 [Xylaria hypoxylon]